MPATSPSIATEPMTEAPLNTVTSNPSLKRQLSVFQMDLWTIVPYYTSYLTEGLLEEGMDATLGSITYHLDPDCFRRHGIKNDPGLLDIVGRFRIRSSFWRRGLKFAENLINMLALAIRMMFRRPDILHVQYLQLAEWKVPLDLWFCRFAKMLGCKVVYTVHNVLPIMPVPSADGGRAIFANIYKHPDAFICHNQRTAEQLIKEFAIDPSRIWVIPHGPMFYDLPRPSVAEAKAKLGIEVQQSVVLFQGIIAPYKGVPFLLDAWQIVQRQRPNARLVIAGGGQPQWLSELKEQAKTLGIEASVKMDFRFIPTADLPVYYQAADILVYPYKEITGSGALLTGLSFAKPIVATNLKAFREELSNGEAGLLEAYGEKEKFAAALICLIDNPELRSVLGEKAGQVTESWASIAQKTRKCYESLLDSR